MTENELARIVVDAAYQIHTKLGPGLIESAVERVLAYELKADASGTNSSRVK